MATETSSHPYDELVRTVTADVTDHPRDLSRLYSQRHGWSRVTATKYIRRLEKDGWLARSGPSTHPVLSPGYRRRRSRVYDLQGLQEDTPWEQDFAPLFSLRPNVRLIAQHGFTEMVNNAIDHSEGRSVFIYMSQDEAHLRLTVSDDGIGIFKKIADALNLPDRRQAIFELAKGKLTTDPSKHSGEGVFFTSRMFDRFDIEANGLVFSHLHELDRDWLQEAKGVFDQGTTVHMQIGLASERTTTEVFQQYMDAPEDYGFTRTVVPMRLAIYGGEELVSRSQAKRLIARFDRFRTVILDFADVPEIGQAFADELFRVYAHAHPDVDLLARNMSPQVEQMYRRALTGGGGINPAQRELH